MAGGVGILAAGAFLATDSLVGLNSETAAAADAGVRTRLTRSVVQVEDSQPAVEAPAETGAVAVLDRPAFADASVAAGIDFVHNVPGHLVFPLGGGVVVFDHDGDGLDDIFIANMRQPNALYRNNGDATFTNVAASAGLDDPLFETNGGCSADYDNDGDQDLYTTIHGSNKLFRNSGAGVFEDVSAALMEGYDDKRRFSGCAWGDYDADGFLDLIVVSHLGEVGDDLLTHRDFGIALRGLSLFHNEGGTFSNVPGLLGDTSGPSMGGEAGNVYGAGFQPAWLDYDEDGDLDLYVVNDLGREIQPNVLWRNDGPGGDGWLFEDVSRPMGASVRMDGMGLAIGDYDLDGRFDIFLTNINDNVLLRESRRGRAFRGRGRGGRSRDRPAGAEASHSLGRDVPGLRQRRGRGPVCRQRLPRRASAEELQGAAERPPAQRRRRHVRGRVGRQRRGRQRHRPRRRVHRLRPGRVPGHDRGELWTARQAVPQRMRHRQ